MTSVYWLLFIINSAGMVTISPPFFSEHACMEAKKSVDLGFSTLRNLGEPANVRVVAGCQRISHVQERES